MAGSRDGRRERDGEAAGTDSAPNRRADETATRGYRCRAMGELGLYDSRDPGESLLGPSKPAAILVYLALSADRRRGRDHIAQLFWRSASPEDARHSLRQALYRLRLVTEVDDLIVTENGDLVLDGPVWLDCLAGEAALGEGDPARAYELLAGDFLCGFSIPDSREFQTWAETQDVRFRSCWERAAFELVRGRLREGDPERALDPAERLSAARPFDEEAVRLLMSVLAASGRYAAAIARYEAFADFLRAEDYTEPSASLLAYRDELRGFLRKRGDRPAHRLPFVGRAPEWAQLEGAWESAREGVGSLILVEGAAGMGKTRLLTELAERVRSSGGLVLGA
ncbi:MAG: BTAD domain-containing putative transcriptional regulator, partial [Gemmatimonadota bacterium]|nr:BTAD domain-containing putative transcriptional regulator [Gemmatimonadota bacterium]